MPEDFYLGLDPSQEHSRTAIGEAGEETFGRIGPCLTCGRNEGWNNLNDIQTNFPGVDLQCARCGDVVQVKTYASPISQNGMRMSIPVSAATIDQTLTKYKGRIRFAYIYYEKRTFRVLRIIISSHSVRRDNDGNCVSFKKAEEVRLPNPIAI